jgi:hypothetical protein
MVWIVTWRNFNFSWNVSPVLPCNVEFACYIEQLVTLQTAPASVAQLAEPRFCKPEVVGSSPTASSPDVIESLHSSTPPSVGVARMLKTGETQFDHLRMGEYPSGQRGQTVNLVAQPSQVRILLPPILFCVLWF